MTVLEIEFGIDIAVNASVCQHDILHVRFDEVVVRINMLLDKPLCLQKGRDKPPFVLGEGRAGQGRWSERELSFGVSNGLSPARPFFTSIVLMGSVRFLPQYRRSSRAAISHSNLELPFPRPSSASLCCCCDFEDIGTRSFDNKKQKISVI